MLIESEVVNPAKEKNLIDGVITITAGFKLPDGSIIQALGKQSEVPIGIFCSEAFTDKLPVTLIAFPGSFDDPRVRYKIAPWQNQSDLFKAKLFSRLINITSQGFLETIDWGETDTNLLFDNQFRSQLEKTFKNSSSINDQSDTLATEEFLVDSSNEIEDDHKHFYNRFQKLTSNEIIYKNKRFPSISALARYLKIRPETLSRRIRNGWEQERWGEKKNNEIQYQGQRFPSIAALAKFLHINPQTLRSRIFKGWPEERWGDKLNG